MAETTKLSVGQAFEKLRDTDAPKGSKELRAQTIDALNEETQRLRAMRLRLERDQQAGSIERDALQARDAQQANARRTTKLIILGIMIGTAVVISVVAWKWHLLWP